MHVDLVDSDCKLPSRDKTQLLFRSKGDADKGELPYEMRSWSSNMQEVATDESDVEGMQDGADVTLLVIGAVLLAYFAAKHADPVFKVAPFTTTLQAFNHVLPVVVEKKMRTMHAAFFSPDGTRPLAKDVSKKRLIASMGWMGK